MLKIKFKIYAIYLFDNLQQRFSFFLSVSGNDGYECFSNGGKTTESFNGVYRCP